jgi:hypothetical protein
MSNQHQFFVDQAEQARRDADAATLDNVRERCLRSAAAWAEMARRASRTERMRAESEAAKRVQQMERDAAESHLVDGS